MSQVAKQCLECRRKKVDAVCANCGCGFQHKPSKPRASCSPACAYALRGRASGDTQSRKVDLVCKWCGKSKQVSPVYASRQYCSRACTAAARSGENSRTWKGGVTSKHQAFFGCKEWKLKCREVYARDRGLCQRCGTRRENGGGHVHHIKSWARHADERLNSGNLVLLCVACHKWVHSKRNHDKQFLG